jgi:DNA-binding transcriptional MerR regulator
MKDMYSIGEVAQGTGIPSYRIKYAIENLKIPGPSERFGNLRVFTPADVQRIREHFKGKTPMKKGPKKP